MCHNHIKCIVVIVTTQLVKFAILSSCLPNLEFIHFWVNVFLIWQLNWLVVVFGLDFVKQTKTT